MKYNKVIKAVFAERQNRFVATVITDNGTETVHVKNTGRCKELLVPGYSVYLSEAEKTERKTKYDLIAVEKQREGRSALLINMDSQIPNGVACEWLANGNLFSKNAVIRREVKYGNSRFDIYVEDGDRKAFVEVKGVTLEENGTAMFPDAPTERGIKHLNELVQAKKDGYEAYILFVIQMKGVTLFRPNDRTHKAFGDALRKAKDAGVEILAVDCIVEPDRIFAESNVKVDIR